MGHSDSPLPPPLPPPLPGEHPLPDSRVPVPPPRRPAERASSRTQQPPAAGRSASSSGPQTRAGASRRRQPEAEEKSLVSMWLEAIQARLSFPLSSTPPWLISSIVHMLMLIVLALITTAVENSEPELELSLVPVTELGDQLIDPSATVDLPDASEVLEVATADLTPVTDPFAAPAQLPISPAGSIFSTDGIGVPNSANLLSGRGDGASNPDKYGGSAITQGSVEAALEWLKRRQRSDGSWSLKGPYSDGSYDENEVAATAMALLAFQGAGNTHLTGAYRDQVRKGWSALLKSQTRDGDFKPQASLLNHQLYTHAQATIAICELYGMTKDSKFRAPAERAVKYCIRSQSNKGGWRYQPNVDSDLSVTGWFVMALQSAKMAGIPVPKETFSKISYFLDSVQTEGGSRYQYTPGREASLAMTAEGLLCRQYLGWSRNNKALIRGVAVLNANPIRFDRDPDVYYWYYATQVAHHMGGKAWSDWDKIMKVALPAKQVSKGPERGSWDPGSDAWGQTGRLYVTCLSVYMLEVYYRHLPLYRSSFTSDFSAPSDAAGNDAAGNDAAGNDDAVNGDAGNDAAVNLEALNIEAETEAQ